MPSLSSRGLRLALAVSVAVATVVPVDVVRAAGMSAAPSGDADVARAKELYQQGRAKYDTFDYDGAIDLWTQAYSIVPETAAETRNLLVYNIATAQEKAYGIDNDVTHLKTASLLLQSYIANYKAINEKTPETKVEVDKAEARIASLQQQIAEHEGAPAPAPAPAPVEEGPEEPPPEAPEEEVVPDSPEVAAEKRKAKGMIAGGYASMGVGVAMLLASGISFAVARVSRAANNTVENIDPTDPPEDEVGPTERRATIAGWVLLGVGVAGLVSCGVLLGLGYSKRSKINKSQQKVSFAPYGTPWGGGAVLTGRF